MLHVALLGQAGLRGDGDDAPLERLVAVGRRVAAVDPGHVYVGERQVPAQLGVAARECDGVLLRRCAAGVDVVDLLHLHARLEIYNQHFEI